MLQHTLSIYLLYHQTQKQARQQSLNIWLYPKAIYLILFSQQYIYRLVYNKNKSRPINSLLATKKTNVFQINKQTSIIIYFTIHSQERISPQKFPHIKNKTYLCYIKYYYYEKVYIPCIFIMQHPFVPCAEGSSNRGCRTDIRVFPYLERQTYCHFLQPYRYGG